MSKNNRNAVTTAPISHVRRPESERHLFIPDVGHEDADGRPDWFKLTADSRFFGAILKATHGLDEHFNNKLGVPWFLKNWSSVWRAGGQHYGEVWFRGSYHQLDTANSGAAQAQFFLRTVDRAGGWGPGDLPPAVNVELLSNRHVTPAQVVDTTSEWAQTVKAELGCKVVLHGHELMSKLHITSQMNCDYLWAPRYRSGRTDNRDVGWPDEQVVLWQYTDGDDRFTPYPTAAPGIGPCGMNIFLTFHPGDIRELRDFARHHGPSASMDVRGS